MIIVRDIAEYERRRVKDTDEERVLIPKILEKGRTSGNGRWGQKCIRKGITTKNMYRDEPNNVN